jgi:hypothetical protein
MPCVPGVLTLLLDEDEPVLGEFPYRLGLRRHERCRRAEEPLVPLQRRRVVGDRDTREEVHRQGF